MVSDHRQFLVGEGSLIVIRSGMRGHSEPPMLSRSPDPVSIVQAGRVRMAVRRPWTCACRRSNTVTDKPVSVGQAKTSERQGVERKQLTSRGSPADTIDLVRRTPWQAAAFFRGGEIEATPVHR